jgi:hypothetical protein
VLHPDHWAEDATILKFALSQLDFSRQSVGKRTSIPSPPSEKPQEYIAC